MRVEQYKVVFDGELVPGMTADIVRSNLAKLFKSDAEKVDRLFGDGPVNIKRDLSALEADRYVMALERAGARARKELEAGKWMNLALAEDEPSPEPAAIASMQCPKCGHAQPPSIQCVECGIVIEKYLARQAQRAETNSPAAETSSAAQPYAPPRAAVAEPFAEHGDLRVFTIQGRIGRLRYLAWSLCLMAAALALWMVASMTLAVSVVPGVILIGLFGLCFMVVSVQIGVQRLHDMGWSGWLMLLNLVPVIGTLFPFVMMLIPGNDGANRFGAPQPPNTRGVKILAAVWLLVPVVGAVAAIALPSID